MLSHQILYVLDLIWLVLYFLSLNLMLTFCKSLAGILVDGAIIFLNWNLVVYIHAAQLAPDFHLPRQQLVMTVTCSSASMFIFSSISCIMYILRYEQDPMQIVYLVNSLVCFHSENINYNH